MKDLSHYRKSYEKSELLETTIPQNPLQLFNQWFHEQDEFDEINEANAMTISTIGLDGFPKSRVVLLKKYDENGFVFYTNYESEKGKSIANNPNVCLSFFWNSMERQVIIKGVAEKISEKDSDNYFNSRPKGNKLGAIVSPQSQVIPNREFLEQNLVRLEVEFKSKEISRPKNWGGYSINPIEIEFWQGRANRLHDRIRYQLDDNSLWKIDRLSS